MLFLTCSFFFLFTILVLFTMLSIPCFCISKQTVLEAEQCLKRRSTKHANNTTCTYRVSTHKSSSPNSNNSRARNDGVVVVNANLARPRFPKIDKFDVSKVYSAISRISGVLKSCEIRGLRHSRTRCTCGRQSVDRTQIMRQGF